MKFIHLIFFLPALLAPSLRAQPAVYQGFGYFLSLPGEWERRISGRYLHSFHDTSHASAAVLSISREDIDTTIFPLPGSWTQARFRAYLDSVAALGVPLGETVFYDSSPAAKLGTLRAPEAFAVFSSPDTGSGASGEYVRYCAVAGLGYRLAAAGDSADMADNIDYYAELLASVRIAVPAGSAVSWVTRRLPGAQARPGMVDMRGRRIFFRRTAASPCYFK